MEFNDNLLKAISWTLVHSIWQGFVLALLAGLVILMTRKSSSALRYNLLSGLFLSFVVVSAMTFRHEFHQESIEVTTSINLPAPADSVISKAPGFGSTINILEAAIDFLNTNAKAIALIWFIILAIKAFNLLSGLGHVYRIRNYKVFLPSEYWKNRVDFLATQINLKQKIRLLESGIVKVPSVVGLFKPVILIPVGLLASLPQDQIEAILLHELAHIKRNDYFINIFQSLAEVIFFFNPGVLWLSSILKEERENCCDDLAIAVTDDKKRFVTALVAFETYNAGEARLALGFFGKRNNLLSRAKRIIYSSNKSLNVAEKTFLGLSLAMVAVFAIACSNGRFANLQDQQQIDRQAITTDIEAQKADRAAHDFVKAQAKKDKKMADQSEKARRQADPDAKRADDQAKAVDAAVAKADESAAVVQKKVNKSVETTIRTVDSRTKAEHSLLTESRVDDSNGSKNISIFTGISGEDLPDNIDTDQLTSAVISDLISEKIVTTKNNLSYRLSNQNLIVNNVVQPQSQYEKLRKKYLASAKVYAISYNFKVSGMKN